MTVYTSEDTGELIRAIRADDKDVTMNGITLDKVKLPGSLSIDGTHIKKTKKGYSFYTPVVETEEENTNE